MARYIDADALIEKIREKFKYNWEIPCTSEDRFIQEIVCKVYDLIYKQPIADVVEVVRCKDCKYFLLHKLACVYPNHNGWCTVDDYCNYGERKCEDESV